MTMTQGWMVGIIALMVIFGICAAVFAKMGKEQE